MPRKRPPQEMTEKDTEEIKKMITELKKGAKYPEPGDNYLLLKDPHTIQYPEPIGGEMRVSKEVDTHRILLKQIRPVPTATISNPEHVRKLVSEMEDYDRERFKVIFLDTKNRVLGVENIAEGTINAALVHPRETVKGALLQSAAGVIFVHNHPSGIPAPSREDNVLVDKLIEAFGFLGIDVIDAIIIGKEGIFSYRESGKSFKPLLIGGIMESREDTDACTVAMKAAMETMSKYCGEGVNVIEIDGMKFTLPYEVMQIREDVELTHDQRVKAIQESRWAQGEARGLCSKLFGQETKECIERVSRKLAEGMVRKGS